MTQTITTAVGAFLLIALAAWTIGGLLLRTGGLALTIGGAILLTAGNTAGAIVLAAGAALWLCGQLHYATRHHYHRSSLARRLFTQTPLRRVDPAKGWSVPVSVIPGRSGPASRADARMQRPRPRAASRCRRAPCSPHWGGAQRTR